MWTAISDELEEGVWRTETGQGDILDFTNININNTDEKDCIIAPKTSGTYVYQGFRCTEAYTLVRTLCQGINNKVFVLGK